ncbi:MAG: hypothetical protein FWE03_03940 [Firmicutes bacterium]|nr:hypothetical protein [Bacillota bacterium]
MLTIQEIKKNISFFVIMMLVLALLLSAGVSLFNFSFEINQELIASFDEVFRFGYEVSIDGFHQNTDEWRQQGVLYAGYWSSFKNVEGLDDLTIMSGVFQFEDNLPPTMQRAYDKYDDFLVAGRFWTSMDNDKTNGRFPIFISDELIEQASKAGILLKVGDEFNLFMRKFIDVSEYLKIFRPFFIAGIFKLQDNAYANRINHSIISIAAELSFREELGDEITTTTFIFDSIENLRLFEREANRQGLRFYSWVLEQISLVAMFSGIFIVVSLVILLLSGLIVFIYASMIINKRISFIGILKAMGMTNFHVTKIFFLILLIAFALAFILANIFSVIISSHFAYLAYTLFDFNIRIGFNLVSQIIFAGAIVVIAFLASALLYKKIKKISTAKVLTLKE